MSSAEVHRHRFHQVVKPRLAGSERYFGGQLVPPPARLFQLPLQSRNQSRKVLFGNVVLSAGALESMAVCSETAPDIMMKGMSSPEALSICSASVR